ncbi:alkaline phosphatase family protein [uncultured Jatrophihabitans sp.]|uniref:alkaline phosphatase family protein n=1 Tax=uncultured Jatrophihabitans sp. TaxID=1610747 RepID=UPI0035CC96B2
MTQRRSPATQRRSLLVRALTGALTVAALAVIGVVAATGPSADAAYRLPAVKHIWNIVLENEDYAHTFGHPSADPYLAKTLPAQGALLQNYYGTGHESNDNYLALVSGQPPNPATQSDCQIFANFPASVVVNGVESGVGCVYDSGVSNIGSQLSAKGRSWKAYQQDMGNDPSREAAACGRPALNKVDKTQKAESGDQYAARHNPFVYFHSVIDSPSYCAKHVVALGKTNGALPKGAVKGETGLATDLRSAKTTPAYSFITPNLCSDGHDYPCATPAGKSALANIDSFLATWVPKIKASPAYKEGGLIEITFDESDGPTSDSSACCGEQAGPSSPKPGITGPGGGRVGAVLISPFIKPGTRVSTPYNHYSTLATDELLFGLSRLGMARTVSSTFGANVFTAK